MTTEGHCKLWAVTLLLTVAGCHRDKEAVFREIAPHPVSYVPVSDSGNAFDSYALAAIGVERAGGKNLTRAFFYPAQRAEAIVACKRALSSVASATASPCEFHATPRSPLTAPLYERGWRLIGRCFAWLAADECAAGDFDQAISKVKYGTIFGFDLTGGTATDASVGLAIADDLRRVVAPYLGKMSASQLASLELCLKSALARKPDVRRTIANELSDSLLGVQELQDAYREHRLSDIERQLGPDSQEPLAYLQDLSPDDPKRERYFDGLASYVKAMSAYASAIAGLPNIARRQIPTPAMPSEHPWRRLAKVYTRAALPLLDLNDATMARTKLWILEAEFQRRVILNQPLPNDLGTFPTALSLDPYSGKPFVCRCVGKEYHVYSVGADGNDDLEETDATYTAPDLTLERPR